MGVKESLLATRLKRQKQVPKVYQVKISKQNLNNEQHIFLVSLFREAKWLYNYIIDDVANRLSKAHKFKEVIVKIPRGKDKDGNPVYDEEKRQLNFISSQIKQGVADKIKFSLRGLKKLKDNGNKVGALKFKSEYNTIYLKQYNNTFKINKSKNRIKIQGCQKAFRVLGLHQIPSYADIATAELKRVADGQYYIYITCFIDRDKLEDNKTRSVLKDLYNIKQDKAYLVPKYIGADFGTKYAIILSNGIALNFDVIETKQLKQLQRRYNRRWGKDGKFYGKKGARSNNRFKKQLKIRKKWFKITNIRKDVKNRIFAMSKLYEGVYIQDENIKSWHQNKELKLSGKVQSTGLGGIIALLKNNLATLKVVDRYEATTKTCFNCGAKKDIGKSRIYKCDKCGYVENRDVNAARNMVKMGGGDLRKLYDKADIEWEIIANYIFKPNKYIRLTGL